ncbi:MAG: hypothetical protein J6L03_03250 [Bacteroidaceae bacterium]|nr:hypothetical protein [Bacteroidaceae bacterium]
MVQRYNQTSEKHEVYFNVFHSECNTSSRFISKILVGLNFSVAYNLQPIKGTPCTPLLGGGYEIA